MAIVQQVDARMHGKVGLVGTFQRAGYVIALTEVPAKIALRVDKISFQLPDQHQHLRCVCTKHATRS